MAGDPPEYFFDRNNKFTNILYFFNHKKIMEFFKELITKRIKATCINRFAF